MHQCLYCSHQGESYDSVRRHVGRVHKISSSQFYVEYYLNGIHPTCKCGCGDRVRWRVGKFQEWVNGHNSVGENNPMHGRNHTEDSKQSMSETKKKLFADGTLHMWSEGKSIKTDPILQRAAKKISQNKERARKISNALTGVPKSEEHKRNSRIAIKKAWEDPELRERQRYNRVKYMQENQIKKHSSLERDFMKLLDGLQLDYTYQCNLFGFVWDFQIGKTKLLVEVDGDFWHANPDKWPIPIYDSQKQTLSNDRRKNKAAENGGYTLLRFWESDIKNNPSKVIRELLNAIE